MREKAVLANLLNLPAAFHSERDPLVQGALLTVEQHVHLLKLVKQGVRLVNDGNSHSCPMSR